MKIRHFERMDLDQAAEIYVRAYKDLHAEETTAAAKNYLEKFLSFDPARCYVADEGGKLLGAALAYSYVKFGRPVLFLQELFVDPKSRHNNIGRDLVAKIRDSYSEATLKVVPLIKADTAVLNFYNSLGFEREEVFSFGLDD